jgi:hypothetical protein
MSQKFLHEQAQKERKVKVYNSHKPIKEKDD